MVFVFRRLHHMIRLHCALSLVDTCIVHVIRSPLCSPVYGRFRSLRTLKDSRTAETKRKGAARIWSADCRRQLAIDGGETEGDGLLWSLALLWAATVFGGGTIAVSGCCVQQHSGGVAALLRATVTHAPRREKGSRCWFLAVA